MLKKYKERLLNSYTQITILFSVVIALVPLQRYFRNTYNNYTIFQHSSFHFIQQVNLYLEYPKEYNDLFLYNPTFSMLFMPFAYLPPLVGIYLWVALTVGLFYYAVRTIPLDKKAKLYIFYFTLLELITTAQCLQTNLIIVSSILLAFTFLEKKAKLKSSFFINLGFFIKGYGAISGAFYLLKKPNFKSFLYLSFWFILFFCLPLLYYSPQGFLTLYKQWFTCMSKDHDANLGLSVMAFLSSVFHYDGSVYSTQIVAILLLLSSMITIAIRKNYEEVKYLFLAYIMIWVIIFNHCSESPTYITASTGAAIWYITSKKSLWDKSIIIITFFLTVMSPSDLFPNYIREHFVKPYSLKVFGPLLIFITIQISLFSNYVKIKSGNNSPTL